MNATERVRAFLNLIGYTPETLAADLGISDRKAKRILSPNGAIYASEVSGIVRVTCISPDVLMGMFIPGENRAEAES